MQVRRPRPVHEARPLVLRRALPAAAPVGGYTVTYVAWSPRPFDWQQQVPELADDWCHPHGIAHPLWAVR